MIRNNIRLFAFFSQLLMVAALLLGLATEARAEETVGEDRVLNIYKATGEGTPLGEMEIDIYKVASMEELPPLSSQPAEEEIRRYAKPENRITTLVTDVQGFATYNFTENDMPDGVYMVVERFNPATTGPVAPFYISMPTAGGETTLDVHLKGTLETGPDVNMDVNALDNDTGTFAVGQSHTWILRGGVPAGIGGAKSYVLTHVLDKSLTLEPGVLVTLHTPDGRQVSLRSRDHYQLEEGKLEGADRLRLSLTPAGMAYVGGNLGSGDRSPEIRLSFRATINTAARMGTAIPGLARLSYTNSAGVSFESESDHPEVHTGGIHLALTDGAGEPLPGACFRLARLATSQDLASESVQKEQLYIDGQKKQVVFVPFYARETMDGEPVTEMITDREGKALAYGLSYGTYYLVQIKAPDRCNRVTLPIPAAVNEMSHLTAADGWKDMEDNVVDNTITVVNTKFILPETGGMGTVAFAMIGLGMMGAAGPTLLRSRKGRKK